MSLCISLHVTNCCISSLMEITLLSSNFCWWTWHTATAFRRFSVIVHRSQVFGRRNALKLRSASADEAGETSSSFNKVLTWGILPEPQAACSSLQLLLVQLY